MLFPRRKTLQRKTKEGWRAPERKVSVVRIRKIQMELSDPADPPDVMKGVPY
jgi:hypothetical protein